MRVIKLLSLCVLMMLVSARPASAWFEWLDYLSGPGPFWGGRVDVRVWCGGEQAPRVGIQRDFLAMLRETQKVNNLPAWQDLASRIQSINEKVRVVPTDSVDKLVDATNAIQASDFDKFRELYKAPFPLHGRFQPSDTKKPAENTIVAAAQYVQEFIDRSLQADIAVSATAIFISLCPPDVVRTWAVELGSSISGALRDKDKGYPGMGFVTYTAAVTYRLPSNAGVDTLDLGLQGGEYTFFSPGTFDTFHGVLLEPFVDVHFPSAWAGPNGRHPKWSKLSARVGLVFFPQGFDTSQFGATSSSSRHISGAEPTLTATVYLHLKDWQHLK